MKLIQFTKYYKQQLLQQQQILPVLKTNNQLNNNCVIPFNYSNRLFSTNKNSNSIININNNTIMSESNKNSKLNKRKSENNEEDNAIVIEDEDNDHECDSCDESVYPVPPLKKKQTTTTSTSPSKQPPLQSISNHKQTTITDFFSPAKPSKDDKKTTTTTATASQDSLRRNKLGQEEVISPFFSKTAISKPKQEDNKDDFKLDNDEEEHEEEEDEEEKPKKNSTTKKTIASTTVAAASKKKSPSKKKSTFINKFATLNISDSGYTQKAEFNTSKKDKLERVKLGGHVSTSNGYAAIIPSITASGFKAVAFFTNSPRRWQHSKVKDDDAIAFKKACKDYNFDTNCILPHGSYLINLGSPDKEKLQKSRDLMIHEMQNCLKLGAKGFNFHPGSHLNLISEDESIKIVAESIDYILERTKETKAVIECTAGQGGNLGYSFEQLRDIIALVKDKSRVGVCLDTCHMFAAGYNLTTQRNCEVIFEEFDKVVGFNYLCGLHLNDSKSDCGSRVDRHDNIAKGKIGSNCFRFLVNDKRFHDIPMILETVGPYDKEIVLLTSYIRD